MNAKGWKACAAQDRTGAWSRRRWTLVTFILLGGLGGSVALGAGGEIAVPNASFEAPVTFFAYPDAAVWVEWGPVGESPELPGVMDTLDTGVFFNSPFVEGGAPSPYYISNAEGAQLGFIGANAELGLAFYQILDARYEAGATYTLSLGVGESFFFPPLTYNPNDPNPPADPDPALLGIGLLYGSGETLLGPVMSRLVSTDDMPDGPNQGVLLAEISTTGFAVTTADPWYGRQIGVGIQPLLGLSGVWNVDAVRLTVECTLGASADSDLDGDVDLVDLAALIRCTTGPGETERPAGCQVCEYARLDGDADGDVDLRDAAALTRHWGD